MIMQIFSACEIAAYLGLSPDLVAVADSLAASPITEPEVFYASPFNLPIITADNSTYWAKCRSLLPFTSCWFTWDPSFSFLAWKVYIEKKKKGGNPNKLIDPDLTQTEDDISACYDSMETVFMQILLDFFFYIDRRETYESFHVLLYRATCLLELVIQNLHLCSTANLDFKNHEWSAAVEPRATFSFEALEN